MLENGFVSIHRSLLTWRWYTVPFTRIVFEHLILTVNWEDREWCGMTVRRGQRVCSVATLAQETNLSVSSVRTAIKHLKSTNEITSEPTFANAPKCTLFTVVNYDYYQSPTHELTNHRQIDDKSSTNHRQQLNKDNNYNNTIRQEGKEPTDREKVLFGENVYLTKAQHDLLIKDHGENDTSRLIAILDRYKAETGRNYDSDYHAIKKWVVEKLAEERQKQADTKVSLLDSFSLEDFTERPDW